MVWSNNCSKQGYIARSGQIFDATLVPARSSTFTRDDKKQLKEGTMPVDWNPAKRCQKDLEATQTKKNGKSHHGYNLKRLVYLKRAGIETF
ncbi:hypothetical protein NTGBS_760001 [Candidatus Nitrotoga sp. BS]|nr:hypothetical protein NTGBS_760001 [Candidatus Nitrotoga sp. BS]